MGIKKLIKLMQNKNIAEDLTREELVKIGNDVCDGFNKDWDSMADWRADVDAGLELLKPATKSKDTPWIGAANFKTPLMIRARQKFGDRASQELLQGADLVKMTAISPEPDEGLEKRIERVQAVMNWQLTTESKGWMEQHDKLLYDVSCQGDIFKKTYYSQSHGYNISEVIRYPNFAIHQDTTCLEEAARFTHKQFFYVRDVDSFKQLGLWLDVDLNIDEKEDTVLFYEQQTWLDLDDDGVFEPYLVTVHADSSEVVRIKAQYRIDNITVIDEDLDASNLNFLLAKDENGVVIIDENGIKFIKDNLKPIKITREESLTNYDFIKDPQGKFLGVGFFHLLGAYCTAINTTTNQLLDAGTMANLQGGWLAKNFRKKLGDLKVAPGAFHNTELSSQELQQGIRLFDFKEPSMVLFQLNEKMGAEGEQLASIIDLGGALGQQTTATTALSIIQEAQEANGAIILRLFRAMQKEYQIWYRLNGRFINPKQYLQLVNDDEVDAYADFSTSDLEVKPAANPQSSSKIQRIAMAEAQMAVLDQVAATGGNPQPLVKGYLDSIGCSHVDEVYPEITPEQAAMQQEMQAKEEQIRMAELETNLTAIKNTGEAQMGIAQAKLIDAQTKAQQVAKSFEETDSKIAKNIADTFLATEKAETEATKNAVSIVNAEVGLGMHLGKKMNERQEMQEEMQEREND